MRIKKTVNFMAARPTLICTVAGVKFYECPTNGDEVPLVAIYNGLRVTTDTFEMPEVEEALYYRTLLIEGAK